MKKLKVYELNQRDKFKIGDNLLIFYRCDGFYAICYNEQGELVYVPCYLEVEISENLDKNS